MLKPKIAIILFKGKPLKRNPGKFPIMLQVGDDYNRISLKMVASEKEWNKTDSRYKDNRTENRDLLDIEERASEIMAEMFKEMRSQQKPFSFGEFKERFLNKKTSTDIPTTLLGFLRRYKQELEDVERFGDLAHFKTLEKGLIEYGVTENVLLTDIDKSWLQKFEKDRRMKTNRRSGKPVKLITVFGWMKDIRTLFSKANDLGITKYYPFKNTAHRDGYSFSHLKSPRISKTASKEDIEKFLAFDVEKGSWKARRAYHTCLFIWHFRGIPIADAARLTRDDIVAGELIFSRIKTHKKVPNVPINIERQAIIEKLAPHTDGDHLLPILHKDRHTNEKKRRSRIRTITGIVNEGLNEIATIQGIESHFSTYVFRHTFAKRVLEKYDVWTLKETLGHKSVNTTQYYADSMSSKELEKVDSVL